VGNLRITHRNKTIKHTKLNPGPFARSGLGCLELSRNKVGTECGIESLIAHVTSILDAGIDFSSRRNRFLRGINSTAESIPPEESVTRNSLAVAFNFLKYQLC
jgi:hypothetical protein